MTLFLVFIICFLGSLIQGVTGFGFAIVAMSLLPFFIPFKTVSAVVLLLAFILSLQIAFRLRAYIKFKFILPVILASFVGRTIGVYALMHLNASVLKHILGTILILLSIYFCFFKDKIKMKASMKNGITAGVLSGLLGGMFNVGGPPLVMYYFSVLTERLEYNASIQATYVICSIYTIILHLLYGNINMGVIKYTGFGAIAVLTGSLAGLYIFRRLKSNTLNIAIYCFMLVMGVLLIIM